MLKSLTLATVALLVIAPTAQAAPLGMAQVEQTLRKAGYTQIHEIERDDGLWEADVSRPEGRFSEVYQKVNVRRSGYDGRILHSWRDGWLD